MRIHKRMIAGLVLVALSACHKPKPKEIDVSAALPNLPLPPGAELLTSDRTADAMRLVMVSPVSVDSVVSYYRTVLSNDPFRLVNEQTTGKTVSFYAEQDGPSIWVSVAPNGAAGSQVTMAGGGAIPKTAATKAPTP